MCSIRAFSSSFLKFPLRILAGVSWSKTPDYYSGSFSLQRRAKGSVFAELFLVHMVLQDTSSLTN